MQKHRPTILFIVLLALLLMVGLIVCKDYGIPSDEPVQLHLAAITHRYIFAGDPALLTYKDRHYGVFVELPQL